VKDLFASKTGEVRTQIDDIAFVGCNVGSRPARMAAFGKLFDASTVTGYSWWIVRQEIDITIPKGSTESSLRKALAPYAKWVRPPINYVALALAARRADATRKLLVMYASYEGDFLKFPVSFGSSRGFKPIGEAEDLKLTGGQAAAKEKEFDDSPVVPFYKVTVELK
jgi:hypothetical protein